MTNGEFNKLRSQGYKRPISVIQIKANVRKKYSNKGETALLAMLTPMSMFVCFSICMHVHDCYHNYRDAKWRY